MRAAVLQSYVTSGTRLPRPPGTFILPVLHPASFFRNQVLAFTGVEDWKKAVRVQRDGPTIVHPPIEEWQWRPTLQDVERYFAAMKRRAVK